MRIAYLANVRFPSERAHAVQIAHMCQVFAEEGADVTLFANTRVRGNINDASKYFKVDFKFSLERVWHGYFSPKIKISYYFSELFFAINFLIAKKITKFDILYSRHEWILWILSFFINNKKLVWESHEAHYSLPARRILKRRIRTVVISEGILEVYKENGHEVSQFLVAHDGIDESFFGDVETKSQVRERLGLPQDRKIALYIGGFDEWKGVDIFFKASEKTPDVLFVAIGGNEEQVNQYKIKYPRVMFLGARPYHELKDNQQAGDVLVVPNTAKNKLSEKLTSPLKLFAHMTSGVPLVISDIPSLTRVTGYEYVTTFDPDNEESLSFAIKEALRLSKNSQFLREMSLKYTWKTRANSIMKFIRN